MVAELVVYTWKSDLRPSIATGGGWLPLVNISSRQVGLFRAADTG